MREWLKSLDQIDIDCIHQYEYLLGRALKDYEEYHEIDKQVDEMILEWDRRKEFFNAYPQLESYRSKEKQKKEPLDAKIQSVTKPAANASVVSRKSVKESVR